MLWLSQTVISIKPETLSTEDIQRLRRTQEFSPITISEILLDKSFGYKENIFNFVFKIHGHRYPSNLPNVLTLLQSLLIPFTGSIYEQRV